MVPWRILCEGVRVLSEGKKESELLELMSKYSLLQGLVGVCINESSKCCLNSPEYLTNNRSNRKVAVIFPYSLFFKISTGAND